MFGFTAEGAEWFKKKLTDQADGMIDVMVSMYATTSDVYVPYKVSCRQRKALYKFLEQHCRATRERINWDDYTLDEADPEVAAMVQRSQEESREALSIVAAHADGEPS